MYLLLAFNWNSRLEFHRASGLGNSAGAVRLADGLGYRAVECRTYGARDLIYRLPSPSGLGYVWQSALRALENIPKEGPLNCRSLGFARDDKGEGAASMKSGC